MRLKLVISTFMLLAILALSSLLVPVFSHPQPGPRIDTLRFSVIRNPNAARIAILNRDADVWSESLEPEDVIELYENGKKITSKTRFHMCHYGFNLRRPILNDVNFRHALYHLLPKLQLTAEFTKRAIESMVPPAMARWINPFVDPHRYYPDEAVAILEASGYIFSNTLDNWVTPFDLDGDGIPGTTNGVITDLDDEVPPIAVYSPPEWEAPQPFYITQVWVNNMQGIGLTSISHEPMQFATYLNMVFWSWNFDIYWACLLLNTFPDHLYRMLHSSQNFLGSDNPTGINWPELDEQLEILMFNLDHIVKVQAARNVQEMVAGGTFYPDPLPYPAPWYYQAIAYIPVCSVVAFAAEQPELHGKINMFGYGIRNMWSYMNMYWNTPDGNRPHTNARLAIWIITDYPERLNPTNATTDHTWYFIDPVFDPLVAINPWTHYDIPGLNSPRPDRELPWLATWWQYVEYTGAETGWLPGMNVTFVLREGVNWQDGSSFGASDVQFAWEFLRDWMIPRYRYWTEYLVSVEANDATGVVSAYLNTTSEWIPYDLARTGAMFPPQVWDRAWSSTDEILAFDPSAEPGWNEVTPTNLFGTGPFVLQHDTEFITINDYGDLDANRNYWLEIEEIEDYIAEMFHRSGDINKDGRVYVEDLGRVSVAYGTSPGDPYWDPDADITGPSSTPPDDFVDLNDLVHCGLCFGVWREVDP